MSKEKEIDEVYDIIDEVVSDCNNDRVFGVYNAAENVVNAGYRKADEVRKETAKEILTKVRQLCEENTDVAFLSDDPVLKFLSKGREDGFRIVCEYLVNLIGVEVDE